MRHPYIRPARQLIGIAAVSVFAAMSALGADQRTGTHLNSRAAQPAVLHVNEPGEISEILELIQAGQNRDAVALASRYVDELRDMQLEDKTMVDTALYYALNARCIALMTAGETDAALEQCSEAITGFPNRWSAWNSRGTTQFSRGSFEQALADFEQALAVAPAGSDAIAILDRNIELTRQRLPDD